MKYKVGDKVRVRKDLVIDSVYGGDSFPEGMAMFRGKVVTISKRLNNGKYYILEDNSGYAWTWTNEMFEGLANEAPSIVKRINNKHNILNGLVQTDGSVDLERLVSKLENNSAVEHPAHYNQGKIEVIDFIEDKDLNFALGNAVKYICRCEKKNPKKRAEDLRKAVFYLNRQIAIWEREDNQ
jgi:hypothetical protein